MQQNTKNRILSLSLCAALAVSVLLMCVFAVTNEEFAVTYQGQPAEMVQFNQNEKVAVGLQGIPFGAELQWQIQMPDGNVWVNISSQTGETLTLSYALVASIMDQLGNTVVRCVATAEDGQYVTAPVQVQMAQLAQPTIQLAPVQVQMAQLAQPTIQLAPVQGSVSGEANTFGYDETDTAVTTHSIKIHYKYLAVDGTSVFDTWEASLEAGVPFQRSVASPKTQGYETDRLRYGDIVGTELTIANAGTVTLAENGDVTFDLTAVNQDMEITVIYEPLLVEYSVKYFFQNVADDQYTLYDTKTYKGYVGTTPDDPRNQNIDGQAGNMSTFTIEGFTRLYYLPEIIAADGSTMFECYFDRNYYLINFDLNDGFGVAPIYARYEDSVVVGKPHRSGYIFAGWDLKRITITDENNEEQLVTEHMVDGVMMPIPYDDPAADDLPAQIGKCGHGDPLVGNYTFAAIWTSELTTYKVVYWLQDGDKNSFLGSRIEFEMSGRDVTGMGDLGLDEGSGQVCGFADHPAHTANCFECGLAEHIHRVDRCCQCDHTHGVDCMADYSTDGGLSNKDLAAIEAIGEGEPQVGYAYAIDISFENQTYYKLYLGTDGSGKKIWHSWNGNVPDEQMGLIYGDALGEATVDGYTAKKFVANLPCGHIHGVTCSAQCGEQEHAHSSTCYACGKQAHTHHTHSRDCYFYWNCGGASQYDNNAIAAINDGASNPESGYIYLVTVNGGVYPKIYIDGKYYGAYESEIEGEQLGEVGVAYYGDTKYEARKYKAKIRCGYEDCNDCTLEEHSHTNKCVPCGVELHTHSTDCLQNDRHLTYISSETKKVEGDGSTVVNVYYQYKTYTLKFYYAASETTTEDETVYYIVGGSTYFFGGQHEIASYDDFKEYTTMQLLDRMFDETARIGQTADGAVPTLNDATQELVAKKVYSTGSDTSEVSGRTYYYISFQAKYGDDIAQLWPADVLKPVEMLVDAENNIDHTSPNWTKNYAVASAWNGEHHVWYSKENDNETIKGKYQMLDSRILYDYSFPDSDVVSYLCFWENGANIGWSVPELYVYNIWLQCPNNNVANAPAGKTTKQVYGNWYYLSDSYNTCDNSNIAKQTDVSVEGYQFRDKQWAAYFISNTVKDENDVYRDVQGDTKYSFDADNNRIIMSEGWNYQGTLAVKDLGNDKYLLYNNDTTSGTYYDPENPGKTLNHDVYREAYAVDFFYDAKKYTINFWNYNKNLMTGNGVTLDYGTPMAKYEMGVGTQLGATPLVQKPENYPNDLEPGCYMFAGWYTTAECLDNTEVKWDEFKMPAHDVTLYAKWTPIERTVKFFDDFADYDNYLNTKNEDKVYHTSTALHNHEILNELRPGIPERDGYRFAGWFYYNKQGKKTAFNINSMPIQEDMLLYAEWVSKRPVTYTVKYQDENGNELAESTVGYSFAGYTRTVFPKLRTEFYTQYQNANYFPVLSSHSILMKENAEENVFTFVYRVVERVQYTVRYLDADTLVELAETKVLMTSKAILTESAKLGAELTKVTDGKTYLPQNISKQLIVSADSTKNVITFYYVAVDNTGAFTVHYHLKDIKGDGYTEQTEYYYATAEAGTTIDALADSKYHKAFVGFTLDPDATVAKDQYAKEIQKGGVQDLHLYYSRNSYNYAVHYVIKNTDTPLKAAETHSALYDSEVNETGDATLPYNGINYKLVTVPNSQSLTISANEAENVIVFEYEPTKTTLQIQVTGVPTDCQDTFLFKVAGPTQLAGTSSYIELIVAVQGNGTVTIGDLDGTVKVGLYTGTYEVTALTGWSYQYALTKVDVIENSASRDAGTAAVQKVNLESETGNKVVFTYGSLASDWLTAEAYKDNKFTGKYTQTDESTDP